MIEIAERTGKLVEELPFGLSIDCLREMARTGNSGCFYSEETLNGNKWFKINHPEHEVGNLIPPQARVVVIVRQNHSMFSPDVDPNLPNFKDLLSMPSGPKTRLIITKKGVTDFKPITDLAWRRILYEKIDSFMSQEEYENLLLKMEAEFTITDWKYIDEDELDRILTS